MPAGPSRQRPWAGGAHRRRCKTRSTRSSIKTVSQPGRLLGEVATSMQYRPLTLQIQFHFQVTIKVLLQERAAGAGHTWRARPASRAARGCPGETGARAAGARRGRVYKALRRLYFSSPGPGVSGALRGPLRHTESASAGLVRAELSLSEAPQSDCKIGTYPSHPRVQRHGRLWSALKPMYKHSSLGSSRVRPRNPRVAPGATQLLSAAEPASGETTPDRTRCH